MKNKIVMEKTEEGLEDLKNRLEMLKEFCSVAHYKSGAMKITNRETGYTCHIMKYSDIILKSIDEEKYDVEVN